MFGTVFKSLQRTLSYSSDKLSDWDLFNFICFETNQNSDYSRRIKGTVGYSKTMQESHFDRIRNFEIKRDVAVIKEEIHYLLAIFYNNIDDDVFLREECERFLAQDYAEFYYFAFKYVVDRGKVEFKNSKNYDPEKLTNALRQIGYIPISYDDYISALTDILNKRKQKKTVSRFGAVLLTIVDECVLWGDIQNNGLQHWLIPMEKEINNAECDLLTIISSDNDQELADSYKDALNQVHALKWYNYTLSIFHHITGYFKPESAYKELYHLLYELITDGRIVKFPTSTMLRAFLEKTPASYELFADRDKKGNYYLHLLAIALFKLNSAVLLTNLGKPLPDNFTLVPTEDLSKEEIFNFIRQKSLPADLAGLNEIETELYHFSELYAQIENETFETQKIVSFSCYKELFRLVNDTDVQRKYLDKNKIWSKNIRVLTKLVYSNVNYKIYRDYSYVDNKEEIGLMRNFLTDVDIVDQYFNKAVADDGTLTEECSDVFYRKKPNGSGRFILRRATMDDIDDILKLYTPENNPDGKPYRRAVFVVSKRESFEASISAGDAFVVYEVSTNERGEYIPTCLACYAAIVSGFYISGQEIRAQQYYSADMNNKFAALYAKENKLDSLSYLDFDTILVNDGRAGVRTQSYRGGGWQRLMLILAEKLAIAKKCHYICGTVGFANYVSRRNFHLTGYSAVAMEHYTLPHGETSKYYEYIMSDRSTAAEKIQYENDWQREYRDYETDIKRFPRFRDFTISREDYQMDCDVPRLFLLLNIESDCHTPKISAKNQS